MKSCSRPIQWHLPGGTSVQNCVIEEERRLHEAAVETERSKNAAAFERMCAEADQMRAEADQMRAEADQMRAEADQMRKAITVLTERSELAEINYRLIRYSISWRLTAPFRWMIGLLPSRLRGRLRQRLKRLSGRG